MEKRNYTIKIQAFVDKGYWVSVPAFPDYCDQGETFEEVFTLAQNAIASRVERLAELGKPIPVEKSRPRRFKAVIQVRIPTQGKTIAPIERLVKSGRDLSKPDNN